MRVRLLLVDHDPVARSALGTMLDLERDLVVLSETGSPAAAEGAARVLWPDVVLMSTDTPGWRRLLGRLPDLKPRPAVVLLAGRKRAGRTNLRAGGVAGIAPRSAAPELIVQTVREAMRPRAGRSARRAAAAGRAAATGSALPAPPIPALAASARWQPH